MPGGLLVANKGLGNLIWSGRRLLAMSGPEIIHRVNEQVRRAVDRRVDYGWRWFDNDQPLPIFPGLRESVLASRPDGLDERLAVVAGDLMQGKFRTLGVAWPLADPGDPFPPDRWHLDPVTGNTWPGLERFTADVEYRHQRCIGSIKYVWEFNRLQFLQPLAAYHLLTGDAEALALIERAICSWYEANPPFRGVNWNSGIELSLRAHSLIVVSTLCGDALSAEVRRRIAAIMGATLYWLRRYPSRFSSSNNHLVMEAFGLFLVGALMPELPNADAVADARRTLEEQALVQILPDGVGAEQSPTYCSLVAEAILTACLLARRLGQPLDGEVEQRLEAFETCVAWFSSSRAETPAIGDDDEGALWSRLWEAPRLYPSSVAAAVAGYLQRPPVGAVCDKPELRDAVFGSPRSSALPLFGVKTFRDGGYTVVRERKRKHDVHMVLDHGPLGYLSIAAHGHADANAVVLNVDGEPILIDPGTYMYHALDEWRDWFRGTRSHNTLNVGGLDQSIMAGPFMWSHKAVSHLERMEAGKNWSATSVHDGYLTRLGVVHRRRVTGTSDGFVITDTLSPSSAHSIVEVVFQFAPTIDVWTEGKRVFAAKDGRPILTLSFDVPSFVEITRGGERPDQGWASQSFGQMTPATRVSWKGEAPPMGLSTRVVLI